MAPLTSLLTPKASFLLEATRGKVKCESEVSGLELIKSA